MRAAVVGHVEWIRFARVDRIPATGQIAHAFDDWQQAGGGGGVAAVQLALLADEAHLFTVLGNDELGRRAREELESRGVVVHAVPDERPQRWAFTQVDDHGERTITTVGPKLRPRGHDEQLPWHELASMDAVFFVAGDVDALVHARRARVLTATSRELEVLRRGGVELDALIGSGEDDAERYRPGELDPEARTRPPTHPARSSTRTALVTASPRVSRLRSAPGSRARTRSRSRRAAGPGRSPGAASHPGTWRSRLRDVDDQ